MWKFWTFVDDLFVCMIDFQNNSFGCIIVEKSKILVVFIYIFLDWCAYVCWKCVVIFCWVLGIYVYAVVRIFFSSYVVSVIILILIVFFSSYFVYILLFLLVGIDIFTLAFLLSYISWSGKIERLVWFTFTMSHMLLQHCIISTK